MHLGANQSLTSPLKMVDCLPIHWNFLVVFSNVTFSQFLTSLKPSKFPRHDVADVGVATFAPRSGLRWQQVSDVAQRQSTRLVILRSWVRLSPGATFFSFFFFVIFNFISDFLESEFKFLITGSS